MNVRVGMAVSVLATLFFACVMKVDTRSDFAALTYRDEAAPPEPAFAFHVYASVELEAVTAYASPHDAATCFRAIDADWLKRMGARLSDSSPSVDPTEFWGCVAARGKDELPPACDAARASDPDLIAYTTTRVAGSIAALARASVASTAKNDALYAHAVTALARVAELIDAPPHPPPADTTRIDAPALALSGGSANGAFVAGFMFELLWARERALHDIVDPAARAAADVGSRFSALVGTSVGSLISQVLDLYYVDPNAPLTDAQKKAAARCNAYVQTERDTAQSSACFAGFPTKTFPSFDPAILTGRPLQQCALTNLVEYFTDVDEPTLMCVEPGAITGAVGVLGTPHPNLVRFDLMTKNIVDPILRSFSDVIVQNDVTRVVVSVETETNQTLGLDERSCAKLLSAPGADPGVVDQGGREYCLSSGVMASVVLPFFARPLRHTYSGFRPEGECGAWLDGGLRSGFPAYRALRLTRPKTLAAHSHPAELRVLAVDTGRLDGMPNTRPTLIHEVALNAIGQMAGQNDVYEIVMAQQFAAQRERAIQAIRACPGGDTGGTPQCATNCLPYRVPNGDGGIHVTSQPNLEPDDWTVSPVFVPTDVPSSIVAESGYAFDRYVMRGLFTWGRVVAMRRILGTQPDGSASLDRILPFQLAWPTDLAKSVVDYTTRDASDGTLSLWSHAYTLKECDGYRKNRMTLGKARIIDRVPDCNAPTDTSPNTPHYFTCPTGANEP